MDDHTCVWETVFDDYNRKNLENGIVLIGFISVIASSWLNLTLLLTALKNDISYRNLAFFTTTAGVSRVIPLLSHLRIFVLDGYKWYNIETVSCEFIGFWGTFLAVLEVECLTHVCIERYVVAKYISRGWQICKNHYILYPCLCFLFACLYSFPALIGFGRYSYDFSCTTCTLDMVLPSTWRKYIVVTIFLLRSVKSTWFMVMMLIWCRQLEKKYISTAPHHDFTKSTIIVTIVNLLCWSPLAMVRGMVVLSQLMGEPALFVPAKLYVKWALWMYWVSPAATTAALFAVDERLRHKMIHLGSSEDSIPPEKKEN